MSDNQMTVNKLFMRNSRRCLISIIVCILFLAASGKAFSIEEINKKLELKENYSHLLSFNEKIIRYRTGEKEAFKIEILPDIFNDRHEMLIKPLKTLNTNLLVWTEDRIYNFDIKAGHKKGLTEFFDFNEDKPSKKILSFKGKDELAPATVGKYKLDLPPFLPKPEKINDFEIDLPPDFK